MSSQSGDFYASHHRDTSFVSCLKPDPAVAVIVYRLHPTELLRVLVPDTPSWSPFRAWALGGRCHHEQRGECGEGRGVRRRQRQDRGLNFLGRRGGLSDSPWRIRFRRVRIARTIEESAVSNEEGSGR